MASCPAGGGSKRQNGLKDRHDSMDPSLKILIVDESPIRAAILEDGLREAGLLQQAK